jgi:alpha-tubulin suppressor-like RCC1 family protein
MKSSLQPKPALIVLLAILMLAGSSTAAGAVNPLSGAQNHGLGLQADGTVCADGDNQYGTIGDGTSVDRKTPVRVAGVTGAVQVATGYYHTLALKSDGTVWGWGFDGNGQLGDGSAFDKPTPIQVPGLTGIIAVAAGDRHSLALKNDGTVWSWGSNGSGQLGDGTNTGRSTPVQVIQLSGVVAISAGASFSIALKSDGTVWGWGVNSAGQLGDGTNMGKLSAVQVAGLTGVMSIASGAAHTLALKTDGTVWGWGYNGYGELGDGSSGNFRFNIVRAGTLTGVVSIASGDDHSLAVKSDGTIWAWGLNNSGQLGDATNVQRLTPVQVSGFTGGVAVGAGTAHSFAVKSDGSMWAWGSNSNGQLGNGTLMASLLPVASSACGPATFQGAGKSSVASRLSATQNYSLAVKGDGTVVGSGDNTYGQLGDGTTTNRSSATAAAGLNGIVQISAGWYHAMALKNDGTVRAWGFGGNGQLGDGTVISKPTPIQVPGLSGIVAVAAGDRHSLALKNDGTVWAWGSNGNGQIGDGTNTGRQSPVQVIQLSGVVGISAGVGFSVALKSDGTVWAWGVNSAGQLGDGTNVQKLSPVQVAGLTNVQYITAGPATHTLALKTDGTVWGWGYNGYGELGDGSQGNFRYNIVRASDLTSIIAIATVDDHSSAVKSDGTVFSWGLNNVGQLGDGSIAQRLVAVPVTGFSGGLAVAVGTSHSWALKNDGFVWVWGSNSVGQFGIPTPASTTVPIAGPQIGLPPPPSLSISKMHTGNFTGPQTGATYTLTVSNGANAGPTTAGVTVTETIPAGLTLTGMAGTGWICSTNTCTRSDILNGGVSYPAITVTVNVATVNSTMQVTNQASVSGGGSATANASDPTTIMVPNPCTYQINPISASPAGTGGNGSVTVTTQTGCTWTATPNVPWISNVTSSGIGSGPANYTVAQNTGAARIGTATIAGQTLTVNQAGGPPDTTPPFGSFDTPADNSNNVVGAVGVTGWALDNVGVTKVEIYRDAVSGEAKGNFGFIFIGTAVFVSGARPDVQSLYPNLPNANRAGWGYQLLTNFLPNSGNGTFKLHAIAFDGSNNTVEIGTGKTIICTNNSAAKPFGTIDTPGQGETISGNGYINFGWALTPGANFMIPINGSTITVVVDGVILGSPTYNNFRSDIASLFPGYTNSQGAVGFFFLDTTKLTNGVHAISWNAYDNANRGEGLGSRYFTVANGTVNVPVDEEPPLNSAQIQEMTLPAPDGDGVYSVDVEEMERIELPFGVTSGYSLVNGANETLPVGSTLKRGVFYWQLGPGFLGEHHLVLSRPDGQQVEVRVRIHPKTFGPRSN